MPKGYSKTPELTHIKRSIAQKRRQGTTAGGWVDGRRALCNFRGESIYRDTARDILFIEQEGVCAICGKTQNQKGLNGEPYKLHMDHNHTTGEVRGLLCQTCNTGLGYLEKKSFAVRAQEYLEEHHG